MKGGDGFIACKKCDDTHCPAFVVPVCAPDFYRPLSGKPNDKGFVTCQPCADVHCPDFKIPDC